MSKSLATIVALSGLLLFTSVATAGLQPAELGDPLIPDLIYDSSNGNVKLDIDGAVGFQGYVLNSASQFLPGNHVPFMGGVVTALTFELAEATFGTPAGPWPYDIGNVFPSGLDQAGLEALLTNQKVSLGQGNPDVPFELFAINVGPSVPEPATFAMGAMGLLGVGLAAWRRRRTC